MGDTLVRDYLHRLDVAAGSLPPDRRSELRQEIADHIAQARAAGDVGNEAALRQLVDRIGDPDDIVAAAREEETSGHRPVFAAPAEGGRRGIGLEIAAVMLLTVGSIIPLLGWLAGVVLLWVSQRWRTREKVLATLVTPGGPFTIPLLLGLLPGRTCSSGTYGDSTGRVVVQPETCTGFSLPLWLGIPILVVGVVGPFIIGGVLLRRARVRADSEAAGAWSR